MHGEPGSRAALLNRFSEGHTPLSCLTGAPEPRRSQSPGAAREKPGLAPIHGGKVETEGRQAQATPDW